MMNNTLTMKSFFDKEYSGSANEILYRHINDLQYVADELSIDVHTALNYIALPSSIHSEVKLSDTPTTRFVTNKKTNGRAAIWLKVKNTRNGIEYPFITLKSKGSTLTWSGYEAFQQDYNQQKAISGNKQAQQQLDQQKQKQAQQVKDREQARQKKQLQQLAITAEHKKLAEQLKTEYLDAYARANTVDGLEPYLVSKNIANIVTTLPNIRTIAEYYDNSLSEWRAVPAGQTMPGQKSISAIPMARLGGKPAGLQRLSIQGKYQTKAVNEGDYNQAFALIGPQLINGKQIDVCEGFATTVTAYAATGNSSLFAMNADNVKALVPLLLAAYPDSVIRVIADNDYQKALQGKGNKGLLTALDLLHSHGHKRKLSIFVPNVASVNGTDINDIHVKHPAGLAEVTAQLKAHANHYKSSKFDDRFQLSLQRFSCLSHLAQKQPNHIKSIALSGVALCPSKYSLDDVTAHIIGMAKSTGHHLPKSLVSQNVRKAANGALWGAQKSRAFSRDKLNQPNISYKYFNDTTINDDVFNYINSIESGIIILRAPMGSGKTQRLIKPLVDQPGTSAYLAHRVSLISGATEALNSRVDVDGNKTLVDSTLSIKHYRNDLTAESAPFINKLACCVNSVINPIADTVCQNLDQLFIDEAAQTLDAITVGGAMFAPQQVFKKIVSMMQSTRRVVLCDADANDNLVTLCELAAKSRTEQQIHIIELKTDCSNISILHTDHASIVSKIEDAAKQGKRLVIATDNCAEAEAMHQTLIAITGKMGVMITGNNSGDELQQAFLTNLNSYVDHNGNRVKHSSLGMPWLKQNKIAWVIYSPAITSGVSIEIPYFDCHFGRFSGISISPSEAIQMLRRDRTAKQFIIGLKPSSNNAENDPNKIISAFYRAELERNDISFEISDDFTTTIKTADPDFDRMRALSLASLANSKSSFANNMLWSLVADGYKVELAHTTDEEIEHGKLSIESSREIAREALINLISGVATPSAERLGSLESKKMVLGLSASEQAEIIRHEIETKMQMPVNDQSIIWHKNGAMNKLKRAELLFTDTATLAKFDNGQKLAGRAASRLDHATKKQQSLFSLFEILGIDPSTGGGEPSTEKLRQAYELFTNDINRDLTNNITKLGAPVRHNSTDYTEPTKWVQGAFERCGLKLERTERKRVGNAQLWHYNLDKQSWRAVKQIIENRQANSITDWPVNDPQTDKGNAKPNQTQPYSVSKECNDDMHTNKSHIKQVITKVSKVMDIPRAYVRSQLNKADRKEIVNKTMTMGDVMRMMANLWDFDRHLWQSNPKN